MTISQEKLPRIAMVTNIPSPYREKTHALLHETYGRNYHVFYCAHIESNREWHINHHVYGKTFLKQSIIRLGQKAFYLNTDILSQLKKFQPDVVVTAGFNPTMILAFLWSRINKKKHVAFTDATPDSEKDLSSLHRRIRKMVFGKTAAFIGASNKSLQLYTEYGAKKPELFWSPLCIENEKFQDATGRKKEFDIMFSGQFIERKMPFFFAETVAKINRITPCKVLLIGSGPLKDETIQKLKEEQIEFSYPGFIQQEELPLYYGSAKILFFSTNSDPWGVVANEACATGLPVITTPAAGAANELVKDGSNGYVMEPDSDKWASAILNLLTDTARYRDFSEKSLERVAEYNHLNAAKGISDACEYAFRNKQEIAGE